MMSSVKFAAMLALLALAAFISSMAATTTAASAQAGPFHDIAVEIEGQSTSNITSPGRNWIVRVTNQGVYDAFGVTVDIELYDQVRVPVTLTAILVRRGNLADKYDPSTRVSSFVWNVGRVNGGASRALVISTKLAPGVPTVSCYAGKRTECMAVRGRAVLRSESPSELPALLYNNVDEGWAVVTPEVLYRPAGARPRLEGSLDNPLPQDGETTTLSLTARTYVSASRHIPTTYGTKAIIRMPQGLGQPTAQVPGGTTFSRVPGQPRTWEWNIGILSAGRGKNSPGVHGGVQPGGGGGEMHHR